MSLIGTPAISPLIVPPAEADDLFYYIGQDGSDQELWVTDGSTNDNERLTNLQESGETGAIKHLTATDDALFFAANDEENGWELWTSEGTKESTRRLTDLQEGKSDSLPDTDVPIIGTHGDYVYFAADDGTHGTELWRAHETGTPLELVQDLMPGPASSNPQNFKSINGRLLFQANDPTHPILTLREIVTTPEFEASIKASFDGNHITLTFGEETNRSYLLLQSNDLQNWRAIASYSGNEISKNQSIRLPLSNRDRYFRLMAN